jgi:hypothetical protein
MRIRTHEEDEHSTAAPDERGEDPGVELEGTTDVLRRPLLPRHVRPLPARR